MTYVVIRITGKENEDRISAAGARDIGEYFIEECFGVPPDSVLIQRVSDDLSTVGEDYWEKECDDV